MDEERRRVLADTLGSRVLSGPFAGMELSPEISWGFHQMPYIVGSYEEELHGVIEEMIERSPALVVDIGAAEGYYPIGFARRLPKTTVYAIDSDARARQLCEENAQRNNVAPNVRVRDAIGLGELQEILSEDAAVVCDCEGCELELMKPEIATRLRTAFIVVELHDFIDISISSTIVERFGPTHEIEIIDVQPRDPSNYPMLPATDFEWAVNEYRPVEPYPMQWAVCRPRRDYRA